MNKDNNSIRFIRENCIGCTRCMRVCPNEALRVIEGKVFLIKDKCISCGQCISACHRKAITTTDTNIVINSEKYNICIMPLSFYGLHRNVDELKQAFNAFYQLGFDYVFDTVLVVDQIINEIENYLKENNDKTVVSSFCPAVTKLIKLNFPNLLDNIIPIKPIQEIAAMTAIKEEISETKKDIEVYYFAECPALIDNINNPIGYEKSVITKGYSLNAIFSDFIRSYKNISNELNDINLSKGKGASWAAIGGQKKTINSKGVLAIDGIDSVINVLDLLDEGRLDNVKYIELAACEEGCLGGIYTIENKYIAKVNNENLSEELFSKTNIEKCNNYPDINLMDINIFLNEDIKEDIVEKSEQDFISSLEKLNLINEVYKKLPKIDCSGCGSPSCKAMAEDIIEGFKKIEDCIFININK